MPASDPRRRPYALATWLKALNLPSFQQRNECVTLQSHFTSKATKTTAQKFQRKMCNLQLPSDLRLLWSIVQCISTLILAPNNNTVSSIQPQPLIFLFFDRQRAAHTAHESAWTTYQAILRRISTQSEAKRRTVCISVKPLRRWNAKLSMRSFLSFFFSSPPLNWLVFLSVRSLSAPLTPVELS